MKLKHYLLVLVVVFSSLIARGQFREGFIITLESDTLYGEVFYRMNPSKYDVCRFRTASGTQLFSPEEIQGFGFINDAFFSSQLMEGRFAEVLIAGKITMFAVDNVRYLFKEGYEAFPIDKGEIVEENNRKYMATPRWKGKLSYFLSDCYSLFFDLTKNSGSQRDLTMVIKSYHVCVNEPYIEFKDQKPFTRLEPALYAGTGISNM